MTGREVVRAVEDDVGRAHERGEALGPGALRERVHLDVGIDRGDRGRGRGGLGLADRGEAMDDLALQVGEIDAVAVADGDAADAAGSEVEKRRGAEAARADDKRVSGEEALLRILAELVQQQVAAIPEALLVVHPWRRAALAGRRYLASVAGVAAAVVVAVMGRPFR